MSQNLWASIAMNSAVLLALFVVYDLSSIISNKNRLVRQIINGVLISAICIIIMSIPYYLFPGVIFDTRSILISVTALFFGIIPTTITVVIALIFRVIVGGTGVFAGIATILSSALIGLVWRKWLNPSKKSYPIINMYTMSIAVHSAMLLSMFLLPYPTNIDTIREIGLPVMLIYPITSMLLSFLLLQQSQRRSYQNRLAQSEKKYRQIIENVSDVVWRIDLNLKLNYVSPSVEHLLGYTPQEYMELNIYDRFTPESIKIFDKVIKEELSKGDMLSRTKEKAREVEFEHYGRDGNIIWISANISTIKDSNGNIIGVQGISRDITKRKEAEIALVESERSKSVLLSHLPGLAYRCAPDKQWTMEFISEGCQPLTGYEPEDLINNSKLSYNDIIAKEHQKKVWNDWQAVIRYRKTYHGEYQIITASGKRKWVLEMGQPIYNSDGSIKALEGIVIDIDESRNRSDQIQYMIAYDTMTGVYNRRFFEEKKMEMDTQSNFPISVILADINGVRLINDAFGHPEGDKLIINTAKLIDSCRPTDSLLGRTGGDEFSLLLPNTDSIAAEKLIKKISDACKSHSLKDTPGELNINLSMGYGTKKTPEQKIDDVIIEAEDAMYKSKLLEQESHHNSIITSVMATMYARSHETEEHAERLSELSVAIGKELDLPSKTLDELKLFSMLHDIGKIGIDDRILNKNGTLTDEEWVIMKTHPEIGYRIAMSSSDLKGIADYILYHHERWDGSGYPSGLIGENIPLPSRILAVADAYDAMTQDRVYRKAMTSEYAIKQIEENAGTQFDPKIAEIFIGIINSDILKN